ncbi:ABC-type polysaccharide/polyol phosphate export systems, permease component [Acidovorax sp. MR-S7]|nr:ABC-type polysaccharide/polyol phosphate export systems, permease component [Acidovorax sp. MR-S7]
MLLTLWRHRDLIGVSAKREIQGRYKGAIMGSLWSLFNPVFMLVIYTFVFSVVFKARWGMNGESKTEFALMLFAGLIVFNLFSDCIVRAPGLIVSNVNYVKKVVFPLEVLPVISMFSALFHGAVSLAVWFLAYVVLFGAPNITVLYLPLIIFPYILVIMGLSWILSALGVYLRDVGQMVSILTAVLMFMSPVFYPVTALPEGYRQFLYLNPITVVIEQVRAVIYVGNSPNFYLLAMYWVMAFVIAWLGFAWFQKTRKGFADVL